MTPTGRHPGAESARVAQDGYRESGRAPALRRAGPWLIADLGAPHDVLSWAVVGGGRRAAEAVAWREVRNADLPPAVDPERFLAEGLAGIGLPQAVGFLTSRALDAYVEVERGAEEAWARCVATVGLGNALRAGDPPGLGARLGTINVLCQLSSPLTESALIEALAIAAEARTAAVLEAGVPSRRSGLPATGTGTDCIAVAAPSASGGPLRYAGKHTALGHLVGAAVYEAVAAGAAAWKRENGP
jgi:adenosylcobinamide amidohydrolase